MLQMQSVTIYFNKEHYKNVLELHLKWMIPVNIRYVMIPVNIRYVLTFKESII